ncbi:MAG: YiiD C-terminal domain-containing protein [Bacteroidetes bacterium]|nr:YiiD C-terminal domain-containing protein [Bacteroidota bacterium]HET6245202.1 DUF4442 domain-containing protein [Bacteroidia bacterium]
MKRLNWLIAKAQKSSFYLWLLNKAAARFVPFNKPHSFKIKKITNQAVEIELPYKKSNLNHIKGIHACALATLCEYATGMVLLSSNEVQGYRIILKNIHMTYHYQAKTNVYAKFELSNSWVEENVIAPLFNKDAVFVELNVEVYDILKNHICTGLINWQIKPWNKVKTV